MRERDRDSRDGKKKAGKSVEQSDELISAIMFCFACLPARSLVWLSVCPGWPTFSLYLSSGLLHTTTTEATAQLRKIYEFKHIAPILTATATATTCTCK